MPPPDQTCMVPKWEDERASACLPDLLSHAPRDSTLYKSSNTMSMIHNRNNLDSHQQHQSQMKEINIIMSSSLKEHLTSIIIYIYTSALLHCNILCVYTYDHQYIYVISVVVISSHYVISMSLSVYNSDILAVLTARTALLASNFHVYFVNY